METTKKVDTTKNSAGTPASIIFSKVSRISFWVVSSSRGERLSEVLLLLRMLVVWESGVGITGENKVVLMDPPRVVDGVVVVVVMGTKDSTVVPILPMIASSERAKGTTRDDVEEVMITAVQCSQCYSPSSVSVGTFRTVLVFSLCAAMRLLW